MGGREQRGREIAARRAGAHNQHPHTIHLSHDYERGCFDTNLATRKAAKTNAIHPKRVTKGLTPNALNGDIIRGQSDAAAITERASHGDMYQDARATAIKKKGNKKRPNIKPTPTACQMDEIGQMPK